ncbi:LPS export ABC transporter permease LptG [Rhodobacteraceae bacterium S2214]|nr:LPS export ABC transporter permease LptG [Rhodobacteraceae bacterium S2214]
MILHRYFAYRFLKTFGGVLGIFVLILVFLDLVEQLRRFGNTPATFADIVGLTLLNVPQGIYAILPLIMIIATIALFLGLARSSEMVVTRAAGRSAVRALMSPVLMAFLIGVLGVAVINPIVASTSREFEERSNSFKGQDRVLTLGSTGLWLRQGDEESQTVIRAETANLDGTRLQNVTFLRFTDDGLPVERIAAKTAVLTNGAWSLSNVKIWPLATSLTPESNAITQDNYDISSTLTADQIRDSFGTPSSIPIWDLPAFIERLKTAGFSAQRHQVWLQMELAMPIFLVAMVMIGASFTVRHQRGGRTGMMVLFAIMLSFGTYFLRNFAQILGENGQLPAALAAWAPPLAAIGLALSFLLHREDG